jgi:PhnB protein
MKIQPYLFFEGRCEEAIEYYKQTLGAEVTALMHFREHPGSCAPGQEDKVMHSAFRIGETEVMASDGMNSGSSNFQGVSLALTVPDPATADRHFNALADGGQVQMPLTSTFFSPSFGMVADRFGVSWMIMAAPEA